MNGEANIGRVKVNNRDMHGSRKFCQRGSNSDNVFFQLMRGEPIRIPLKAGHHWLSSEMPLKWHFACGPMLAQH